MFQFLYHCFSDDLETFPNIYDVNVCNPNDNVPTLWAIVNSSSVSFYNVNNIIIPRSTEWKMENRTIKNLKDFHV